MALAGLTEVCMATAIDASRAACFSRAGHDRDATPSLRWRTSAIVPALTVSQTACQVVAAPAHADAAPR